MSEPLLVVISGPSGSGKSTVEARILAEMSGLLFSVSHTTREPRSGEENGRDYFFVDEAKFRDLISEGAFLEWAEVHERLYGTSRAELERAQREGKDLVLDIDVQGAAQIKKAYPGAVTIFLRPPSVAVLTDRLRGRASDTAEVVAVRIKNATGEIQRASEFRHVVVNDHLDATVDTVKGIIETERAKRRP